MVLKFVKSFVRRTKYLCTRKEDDVVTNNFPSEIEGRGPSNSANRMLLRRRKQTAQYTADCLGSEVIQLRQDESWDVSPALDLEGHIGAPQASFRLQSLEIGWSHDDMMQLQQADYDSALLSSKGRTKSAAAQDGKNRHQRNRHQQRQHRQQHQQSSPQILLPQRQQYSASKWSKAQWKKLGDDGGGHHNAPRGQLPAMPTQPRDSGSQLPNIRIARRQQPQATASPTKHTTTSEAITDLPAQRQDHGLLGSTTDQKRPSIAATEPESPSSRASSTQSPASSPSAETRHAHNFSPTPAPLRCPAHSPLRQQNAARSTTPIRAFTPPPVREIRGHKRDESSVSNSSDVSCLTFDRSLNSPSDDERLNKYMKYLLEKGVENGMPTSVIQKISFEGLKGADAANTNATATTNTNATNAIVAAPTTTTATAQSAQPAAAQPNRMSKSGSQRACHVLLIEPRHRVFEIVHVPYEPESFTLEDILKLIPQRASDRRLALQKYSGVAMHGIHVSAASVPLDVLLESHPDCARKPVVAVPEGYSVEQVDTFLKELLRIPRLQQFFQDVW